MIGGWLNSFKGSVHCHQGGEHGSTQADVMLEKLPRVVHPDKVRDALIYDTSIGVLNAVRKYFGV